MKRYRIFFFGYDGSVYDAGKNDTVPQGINYPNEEMAFNDLDNWNNQGKLNLKLTYVVLPIFIPTSD
jgi:hypothetical protein